MLLVADNLTAANAVIQNAIEDRNPEPIKVLVEKSERAGVNYIDINSGPLTHKPEESMKFLIDTVLAVSGLPLIIDTVNPRAMRAGLEACKGRHAIINGFSLEPEKLETMLPLAKTYNTPIIGYLLHPDGHVPLDASERFNLAVELYERFREAGLDNDQIIIDPVAVPITWDNGRIQSREVLSVIRHLPELLGFPIKTIAGVSNLTTGNILLEKKLALEGAYIAMLAEAGLSMALVNMFHQETVRIAGACNALSQDKVFTWEGL